VEDAAAALMLYRKVSYDWEASLGFPMIKTRCDMVYAMQSASHVPSTTLYLDGCNLPMALRRRKNCGDVNTINQYQLLSKTKYCGNAQVCTPVDWMDVFRSLLLYSSSTLSSYQGHGIPPITEIVIFFDGASFKTLSEHERPKGKQKLVDKLHLEVTEENIEVDDVIVERCRTDVARDNVKVPIKRRIGNVDEVMNLLSRGGVDSYFIVRRKGGGSKTNKKLFNKLNLRRREEGD